MKIADKAAAMGIRFEGTSREIYLIHVSSDGKRTFVARCKYANPKTRANQIINAIWDKYCGNVEAFVRAAERTSPFEAAGIIPAREAV